MQKKKAKENQFVGFWIRFVAYVIDFGINITLIGGLVNIFLYFKDSQTIGYKVMGAKIYKLDGSKLSLAGRKRLLGRVFAKIISYIPLNLGFIWIAINKNKQGWHDLIVKTVVIQEQEPKTLLAFILFMLSGTIVRLASLASNM